MRAAEQSSTMAQHVAREAVVAAGAGAGGPGDGGGGLGDDGGIGGRNMGSSPLGGSASTVPSRQGMPAASRPRDCE
jgi:hypothetical protein